MPIALKTGKHTSARVASRMRRQIRGRKKVSETEYSVVKITKFGAKAEKKEAAAKKAE